MAIVSEAPLEGDSYEIVVDGSLVPADAARKEGDVARNSARNRTVRGATEGWHDQLI